MRARCAEVSFAAKDMLRRQDRRDTQHMSFNIKTAKNLAIHAKLAALHDPSMAQEAAAEAQAWVTPKVAAAMAAQANQPRGRGAGRR
jgi:hypothetical protein